MSEPNFEHPQSQTSKPAYGQILGNLDLTDALFQIQVLTRRVDDLERKRVSFKTDLIDLFETVTVAPTITPRSPYEQVKLANIAGTFYIYAYNTNSLSWKRVAIT